VDVTGLKQKLEELVEQELEDAAKSRLAQGLISGFHKVVDEVIAWEQRVVPTSGGVNPQGVPVAAVERDVNLPRQTRVEAPPRNIASDALVQDEAGQQPYLAVQTEAPAPVEAEGAAAEKTETPAEWPAADPAPASEDEAGKHEATDDSETHE
jgi:hypothetical protein